MEKRKAIIIGILSLFVIAAITVVIMVVLKNRSTQILNAQLEAKKQSEQKQVVQNKSQAPSPEQMQDQLKQLETLQQNTPKVDEQQMQANLKALADIQAQEKVAAPTQQQMQDQLKQLEALQAAAKK